MLVVAFEIALGIILVPIIVVVTWFLAPYVLTGIGCYAFWQFFFVNHHTDFWQWAVAGAILTVGSLWLNKRHDLSA